MNAVFDTDAFALLNGPVPAEWSQVPSQRSPAHGAISSFLGVVRNHHRARPVQYLEYRSHAVLAYGVLRRLAIELRERHAPDLMCRIAHATGRLYPGDIAVAIHVASAHRRAAIAACSDAIESIKRDLPVWKRETFVDGQVVWG